MAFINPFDFKTLLLNYFLGSTTFFIYAFIIIVSFACGKYQMPNRLFLVILGISTLIFATYLGGAVYILILLVIAITIFGGIKHIFS